MRIGIDTGGTFTDIVVAEGSGLVSFKVPSTPGDPSLAILAAISRMGDPSSSWPGPRRSARDEAFEIVHGSTVATNALLEGKTARTALLTTEGFEDILEIGRQARPALYDIEVQRPPSLIERELRYGVRERVLASGEIREPLDPSQVRAAGEEAARAGAVSVAVCFLHSYLRPDHENEAGRILREIFPGAVTISSALVREFREYERFSTAAVNAAVSPVVGGYLRKLEAALPRRSLRIMGSNGGALSPGRAASEAVRTVLSGPAAGAVAARRVCAAAGINRLISLDMGGTSTDVSLIPEAVILSGETVIAGHPIRTPAVDIHTVGAGGGSIAWVDPGGALKVGPLSAGADPGPACYARGGPATVTDANLVLGRIVPERFLDGKMKLDIDAARRSISELATRLRMSLEETAAGIVEVASVTMARAIRHVSLLKGYDPAGFTLCAFGGAGGLHAAALAEATGMDEALIPASPGVLSAWGLLASDIIVDRSVTILKPVSPSNASLREIFAPLVADAAAILKAEGHPSSAGDRVVLERIVEARYRGQSHELAVPADGDWLQAFHGEHARRYGFSRPEEEVVAVTLKVVARLPVAPVPLPSVGPAAPPSSRGPRRLWDSGAWREGIAAERATLPPGHRIEGPAVITEAGATTYVPSGFTALLATDGSVRLRRRS